MYIILTTYCVYTRTYKLAVLICFQCTAAIFNYCMIFMQLCNYAVYVFPGDIYIYIYIYLYTVYRGFPEMGLPQNGCFINENPLK